MKSKINWSKKFINEWGDYVHIENICFCFNMIQDVVHYLQACVTIIANLSSVGARRSAPGSRPRRAILPFLT